MIRTNASMALNTTARKAVDCLSVSRANTTKTKEDWSSGTTLQGCRKLRSRPDAGNPRWTRQLETPAPDDKADWPGRPPGL